jgi:PE family
MSCVSVAPDSMVLAAADLGNIASALDEAHRLAAPTTRAVSPAAADEVSVGIAQVFSQHAQDYQGAAREAAAFQGQFVQNLTAGASSYAGTGRLIASLLQELDALSQALNGKVQY